MRGDRLGHLGSARTAAFSNISRIACGGSPSQTAPMLIAQLSDVHVGGSRYDEHLLRTAIAEIDAAEPDLVVVAGDLTDDGYPDQYPLAKEELSAISCPHVVRVPGNHDARNVGYLRFEDTFGARDSRERLSLSGLDVAIVSVDSSKPDLDEGEIGREHYGWIEEGFAGRADLRVFVCHHHLLPVPGTGRERNVIYDAGDTIECLQRAGVNLVLSGHKHVPYAWRLEDLFIVNAGTVSSLRLRGNTRPCYNVIEFTGTHVDVWRKYPFHGQEKIIQFRVDTLEFEKYTARIEGEVTARR